MVRYSLLCATFLLAVSSASANSWADGMFDELSRDFGSVPRGQVVTHPFRVVNNTGSPVRITGIRVSCGCTQAQAMKSTLAPGEETVVLAQMNTGRFYNTKNVTIYVTFDQPRYEEVRLWVQANSRDDVAFSPENIAVGRIKRGTEADGKMNVTFLGGNFTQITDVKCESNYVVPTVKEARRDNNEVVYELDAKVRPDTPAGKWYTDVWLTTNNPAMPRLRVPVTVEVEAALAVSPSAVALGDVKAGEETDRKVIIRGIKAFRITGITGTDETVRVREANAESKTVHVLTVTLSPRDPGELTRLIRVQTDLTTGGDIEFNAEAKVLP